MLQTNNLAIGYGSGQLICDDINVSLQPGELVCLLGPNGAGKTTLLRTLAGLHLPLAGDILLAGQSVRQTPARLLAQRLAIVTTERVEVGMMTGRALVALGRVPHTDWTGQLTPYDEEIITQALRLVNAQSLAERRLTQMSDGERQRVLIARALAQQGTVLLLDEPTAYLDLPRRIDTLHLLRRLAQDTQQAVLLSTHDLDLALKLADVLWLMAPGQPLQVGAPEDLVLSGAFNRAFDLDGIAFDVTTGAFRVENPISTTVRLRGHGLRADWTQRALQRRGCQPGDEGQLITVTDTGWLLDEQPYASLLALLRAIR